MIANLCSTDIANLISFDISVKTMRTLESCSGNRIGKKIRKEHSMGTGME